MKFLTNIKYEGKITLENTTDCEWTKWSMDFNSINIFYWPLNYWIITIMYKFNIQNINLKLLIKWFHFLYKIIKQDNIEYGPAWSV